MNICSKNKNKYINYFITECNENENEIDYGDLIDNYIKENDKEVRYGGDLELSIISSMLNIIIIILIDGYSGYNVFNIYEPENINNLNKNYIFLNFVENKHFEYL